MFHFDANTCSTFFVGANDNNAIHDYPRHNPTFGSIFLEPRFLPTFPPRVHEQQYHIPSIAATVLVGAHIIPHFLPVALALVSG